MKMSTLPQDHCAKTLFTGFTYYRVIVALKNDELIAAAGREGDVMRVVSLLNSGADIQTEDQVCYIIITKKFQSHAQSSNPPFITYVLLMS